MPGGADDDLRVQARVNTNSNSNSTTTLANAPYVRRGLNEAGAAFLSPNDSFALPGESLGTLRRTAGGDYGGAFDLAKQRADAAIRGALPGVQSAFAGGGRLNSGAAEEAVARTIADSQNNAFAGAYQQERQNQLNAAMQLPQLMERFSPENLRRQRIAQYLTLANQSNLGGSTRTKGNNVQTQYGPDANPFLTALGGGAVGAGIGKQFGPWGAAIGGAAGGGLGLLGGLFN